MSTRIYNAAHREEMKVYNKRYRAAHRETLRAYAKAYLVAHSEDNKMKCKVRYAAHKQERAAYNKEYRNLHRQERRLNNKAYYASHTEKYRTNEARRRALLLGLPATLTLEQWEAIKQAYKYTCAYCGAKPKYLTQDHVRPVTKGGGTTPDNIVPACLSCNAAKGNREPVTLPAIRLMV